MWCVYVSAFAPGTAVPVTRARAPRDESVARHSCPPRGRRGRPERIAGRKSPTGTRGWPLGWAQLRTRHPGEDAATPSVEVWLGETRFAIVPRRCSHFCHAGLDVNDAEVLLAYCRQQHRVCPVPQRWNELWELLSAGAETRPARPLILAAWWHTSNLRKMLRLKDQITWAASHNRLADADVFLRALSEQEWHHLKD